MAVAILLGLAVSALTTEISKWTVFSWLFAAVSLVLAAISLYYAATNRSVVGKLPTDPKGLQRIHNFAVFGLAAMALVLIIQVGSALTGSWGNTDGMFLGIYSALAILFFGRLVRIRQMQSGA